MLAYGYRLLYRVIRNPDMPRPQHLALLIVDGNNSISSCRGIWQFETGISILQLHIRNES